MFKPDFQQLLKVLKKEIPSRPVLFEFLTNDRLLTLLAGGKPPIDIKERAAWVSRAYANAGFDFVTLCVSNLSFPTGSHDSKASYSLNDTSVIKSWQDFESYSWPQMQDLDISALEYAASDLPEGMKIIPYSPNGVLENSIGLMGYDNFCLKLYEEPELVKAVTDKVGALLLNYYNAALRLPLVGAVLANDDWGYKNQTLISPEHLRTYIFPWYKRIAECAHAAGKPVLLHSCGKFDEIADDVIEDMRFDAKHSFEDTIEPVEVAYEKYAGRIALLGGIDLDFLCRSEPEKIKLRCKAMLERTAERGGYALGTGNSVPEYLPDAHYLALLEAYTEFRNGN